jgi:DNA invertase Pin-like site-specific DNA recombinase
MAKRAKTYPDGCVIGYLRVSTVEQAESGAGMDAQRRAITDYARRHGLTITRWCVDEAVSGSVAPQDREGLAEALDALADCPDGVLVTAKPDRLARKASDLLRLRDQAERDGWALAAADGSIDTTTPHGRLMTTVLAGVAELERDLIKTRTRDALAARKAAGVRLGRPSVLPVEVRERVTAERAAGASLPVIAAGLTADGVPTVRGGARWYPSTVAAVLRTVELDSQARAAGAS